MGTVGFGKIYRRPLTVAHWACTQTNTVRVGVTDGPTDGKGVEEAGEALPPANGLIWGAKDEVVPRR